VHGEAGNWKQIRQYTSLDRAGLSSCDGRRVEYPGVQRPVDPKPLNPLQFRFCPAPWARQDKKNDRRSRPARAAELRKQPHVRSHGYWRQAVPGDEIGRASCRERVWMTVGAEALKKKKSHEVGMTKRRANSDQ